jgi:hypothetical protein
MRPRAAKPGRAAAGAGSEAASAPGSSVAGGCAVVAGVCSPVDPCYPERCSAARHAAATRRAIASAEN